jgi:hypothetical protein
MPGGWLTVTHPALLVLYRGGWLAWTQAAPLVLYRGGWLAWTQAASLMPYPGRRLAGISPTTVGRTRGGSPTAAHPALLAGQPGPLRSDS